MRITRVDPRGRTATPTCDVGTGVELALSVDDDVDRGAGHRARRQRAGGTDPAVGDHTVGITPWGSHRGDHTVGITPWGSHRTEPAAGAGQPYARGRRNSCSSPQTRRPARGCGTRSSPLRTPSG